MAFLELHNIKKAYYLDKQAFPVLKGLTFNLSRASLFRF